MQRCLTILHRDGFDVALPQVECQTASIRCLATDLRGIFALRELLSEAAEATAYGIHALPMLRSVKSMPKPMQLIRV